MTSIRSRWGPLSVLAAQLTASGAGMLGAATITVEGSCTLPDAIRAAELDSTSGGCAAGFGADTVVLTSDVVLDAVAELDSGNNGLPTISSEVDIEGNGFSISRDPNSPDLFRFVKVTGELKLDQVTFVGGNAELEGGAIYNQGALEIFRSAFVDNHAGERGGALFNAAGQFGGLWVRESEFLANSVFRLGSAAEGGAIHHADGLLEVKDSAFEANQAGSSVAFTSEARGGAIFAQSAARVQGSTLAGNSATGQAAGRGAAVYATHRIELENSTVSANTSSDPDSGAVEGKFSMDHLTVYGNEPIGVVGSAGSGSQVEGLSSLVDSLVLASTTANCAGPLSGLNNGSDDASCPGYSTVPTRAVEPEPRDNGGPTPTHALTGAVGPIDAGAACELGSDQRGANYVETCDLGAYEHLGCPVLLLEDDTIQSAVTHEECAIATGPNFAVVGPAGELTLRAGSSVALGNGFSVGVDGRLTIENDPSLQLLDPGLVAAERARRRERGRRITPPGR